MMFHMSFRSLGVNLLGLPYFVNGKPVCDQTDFLYERGGKFQFISGEQSSYAVLCPAMDAEIRAKFPKVLPNEHCRSIRVLALLFACQLVTATCKRIL
jgi:hypothetical protein